MSKSITASEKVMLAGELLKAANQIEAGLLDTLFDTWRKDVKTFAKPFATVWAKKFFEGLKARAKDYANDKGNGKNNADIECAYTKEGLSALADELGTLNIIADKLCKSGQLKKSSADLVALAHLTVS